MTTATDITTNTADKTKSSKHAAAIEKRTELVHLDPKNITIIGLDTDHKSVVDHPAWDPRALLPVNADMCASLDAEGQLQPIRVYATGKGETRQYIAQAGRQRVKAARFLNEEYAKAGNPRRILIRCEIDAAPDEARSFRVGIAENEIRVDNPLFLKIKQAATMANVHAESRDAIARTFGVSLATISLWFRLWQAPTEIKQAFEQDKITLIAAVKLADLAPEVQKTTLRALLKTADHTVAKTEAVLDNAAGLPPLVPATHIAGQTSDNGPNAGANDKDEQAPASKPKAPRKATAADVKNAASGKAPIEQKPPTVSELKTLLANHDNCVPNCDLASTDPIALIRWLTGDLQPTGKTPFEVALRYLRATRGA